MIKYGGARPTGKAKYLKPEKTRRIFKKNSFKNTLKKKNNVFKNLRLNRLDTIKELSEKETSIESYVLKLSKKFIKLFDSINKINEKLNKHYFNYTKEEKNTTNLNKKSEEYDMLKGKIEDNLNDLDNKETLLERHKSIIPTIYNKLKREEDDDIIISYSNILNSARKIYNKGEGTARDEATILLSTLVEELMNVFFKTDNSTNMNINMNMGMSMNNVKLEEKESELDDLLNMFGKIGI